MKGKKINIPELEHYILGGLILIVSTPFIMKFFPLTLGENLDYFGQINFWLFSAVWILEYIVVDQLLHVVVKHEKIAIIQ